MQLAHLLPQGFTADAQGRCRILAPPTVLFQGCNDAHALGPIDPGFDDEQPGLVDIAGQDEDATRRGDHPVALHGRVLVEREQAVQVGNQVAQFGQHRLVIYGAQTVVEPHLRMLAETHQDMDMQLMRAGRDGQNFKLQMDAAIKLAGHPVHLPVVAFAEARVFRDMGFAVDRQ